MFNVNFVLFNINDDIMYGILLSTIFYRVFIKYCVFSKNFRKFAPLPRQHSAAMGCAKNYQPMEATVHSHCVESFGGLLKRCRRGRGCSEL